MHNTILDDETELAALRDELARVRHDYDMATVEIDGYKKSLALMSKGMEASENGRMEWKLKCRDTEAKLAAAVAERDGLLEALREMLYGTSQAYESNERAAAIIARLDATTGGVEHKGATDEN